jgi:hypothetical protein
MTLIMLGRLALAGAVIVLLAGCSSLLPSAKETVESPWQSFTEAKTAFEKIVPGKTSVEELKALNFDVVASPNLKILNYLDIAATVQSIRIEELDPGLQACLRARTDCRAYVFEPKRTQTRRIGSFWLDLFNFRRKSHETGWRFKALLVLVNNHVAYKLWGGDPQIDQYRDLRNPLGPFQDAGSLLLRIP